MENGFINFSGACPDLVKDYIIYKRSLGYSSGYKYQCLLDSISRSLGQWPLCKEIVDERRACAIAARKGEESPSTQSQRISALRQFCIYLRHRGYDAYVLDEGIAKVASDFVPRIITEQEMARCIEVAEAGFDGWVAALIKILWCCGLRLGEALRLVASDVDLEADVVLIRHAKGDRTRICPLAPSISHDLKAYMKSRELDDLSSYLFPAHRGAGHRSSSSARFQISLVYAHAGVFLKDGRTPRVHDLRHSFAVATLNKLDEGGMDLYAALPLLATYMGHADIKSTEYYLRFTQSNFERVLDLQRETSQAVFGGVEL